MICQLLPSEVYKYLGIMECATVKNQLMKSMLTKEYKWRVRKLLCTKLTSRNFILAVNMYCVSLLCYSGGIVSWSQADLYKVDVMMRLPCIEDSPEIATSTVCMSPENLVEEA